MSIDYALAGKQHPVMKRKLTLAIKSGDPRRIRLACLAALAAWEKWGAWPDDWHRWNIALYDATRENLEDLR